MSGQWSRMEFLLVFWEALKQCGMDYVTDPWCLAMPRIREQGALEGLLEERGE